ncbi:MAG: uncharacterized protein PWQ82_1196 [Thermosediminibacterales bacterium]|nr:uncharacterized protein [Thermosediminibacterales bacterium]MDK2836220.1 uncharacterized protein [Thermosediminibacterales bacterium]
MNKKLTSQNIESLYHGSIFLGSGGGGKPDTLLSVLKSSVNKNEKIPLIPPTEVPDDSTVAAVGIIGSPELLNEDIPTGDEGIRALRLLEQILEKKIDFLVSPEGAGVNILYPLLVSTKAGIPLIDGDGMGRAFPELQMTTFHIYGEIPGAPMVLCDSRGDEKIFYSMDNFLLEIDTRQALNEYGGAGYFAGFAMTGREAKTAIVPDTISFCEKLGEVFSETSSYQKILKDIINVTKNSIYGSAIELFIGFVEGMGNVRTFKLRTINLRGTREYNQEEFKILIQNENLFAYRNNKVAAMVPDLICLLDYQSGIPLNNNDLTPGMEVAVIGIPAPTLLKTKKALNVVGPQCFNYKSGYQPLEAIHFSYYF